MVEGEIINVVSEGVLEFVSDCHETHDYVGCGDGSRDGNPFERVVELEGKKINVEIYDLRDEDIVTDRQRSLENTFGGRGTICHGVHTTEDLTEDDWRIEGSVSDGSVNVRV